MRIYHIKQLGTYEDFAQFISSGAWSSGELTSCCRRSTAERVEPLQIMWIPGSDQIGDFAWDGSFTCAVGDRAVTVLAEFVPSDSFQDVQYVPYDGCAGRLRKNDKIVSLPYTGPQFRWLHVPNDLHIDLSASGLKVRKRCVVCGFVWNEFRRTGLVIRRSNWQSQSVFRIAEFGKSGALFACEDVRESVISAGLSNIAFLPAGEII